MNFNGEFVTIWEVADNGERGEYHRTICFCETKEEAKLAAQGSGWYGGEASIEERHAFKTSNGSFCLLEREYKIKVNNNG